MQVIVNDIEFTAMVDNLAKDGADIISGLTDLSAHLLHMAVGIVGEVEELTSAVTETGDIENMLEELGDLEFYIEGYCAAMDWDTDIGRSRIPCSTPIEACVELFKGAGRLIDATKKAAIYEKELDVEAAELAMVHIQNAMACAYAQLGLDRQSAIEANIVKLGKRYSGGTYSNKAAQDRADKNETPIEEVDELEISPNEDADNLEEVGELPAEDNPSEEVKDDQTSTDIAPESSEDKD